MVAITPAVTCLEQQRQLLFLLLHRSGVWAWETTRHGLEVAGGGEAIQATPRVKNCASHLLSLLRTRGVMMRARGNGRGAQQT